jgi:DNA-directed RNA polymerase subunit RPC12/RpoP
VVGVHVLGLLGLWYWPLSDVYQLKEFSVNNQIYQSGERVEKFCAVCGEERGHVVASVTKAGRITRVSCPKCGTRSAFKAGVEVTARAAARPGAPYDSAHTYRTGQSMTHPVFGVGEVTAVIEPQKIDVLFTDRMRRLIHARARG